jgi:hypothetical protein
MVNIQFLRPLKLTIIFLKGITVDEGSNMVRLFAQIENSTNTEELLTLPEFNELDEIKNNVQFDETNDSETEDEDEEDL